MHILKAEGRQEEFSEHKLITSIKRAGIPEDMQTSVLMHVKSKLYEGIPTSEIYHHITEFLSNSPHPFMKTRYGMKQALMDLGPTGYPFEDYLSRLLQEMGYKTQTRVIVQGKCISHEIDVIAEKNNEKIMVEAKFHNGNAVRTDVHVAMYTHARFEDIKERNGFTKAMLITNTKLTSDAITYGECVGLQMLGWSYPEKESLRDLVEKYHLFPITALSNLTLNQQQQLLTGGVTLCKDITKTPESLNILQLSDLQKEKLHKEAAFICPLPQLP
jgi:hypothetical protein